MPPLLLRLLASTWGYVTDVPLSQGGPTPNFPGTRDLTTSYLAFLYHVYHCAKRHATVLAIQVSRKAKWWHFSSFPFLNLRHIITGWTSQEVSADHMVKVFLAKTGQFVSHVSVIKMSGVPEISIQQPAQTTLHQSPSCEAIFSISVIFWSQSGNLLDKTWLGLIAPFL